jgi:hypothetical protein
VDVVRFEYEVGDPILNTRVLAKRSWRKVIGKPAEEAPGSCQMGPIRSKPVHLLELHSSGKSVEVQ